MTSINKVFLFLPTLSCITLTAAELNSLSIARTEFIPSKLISSEVPLHFDNYSIIELSSSNETSLSGQTLIDEFNVLASFANKMLSEESQIDPEIQNIIDEHFWDMI